jgi:hypothetical protein
MCSIYDVWPSGLGQIVEFTNHGSAVEVQRKRRLVKVGMQMLVDLGWYSLDL